MNPMIDVAGCRLTFEGNSLTTTYHRICALKPLVDAVPAPLAFDDWIKKVYGSSKHEEAGRTTLARLRTCIAAINLGIALDHSMLTLYRLSDGWTRDNNVKTVIRRLGRGQSYSQVARAVGMSRSAVAGIKHRNRAAIEAATREFQQEVAARRSRSDIAPRSSPR